MEEKIKKIQNVLDELVHQANLCNQNHQNAEATPKYAELINVLEHLLKDTIIGNMRTLDNCNLCRDYLLTILALLPTIFNLKK